MTRKKSGFLTFCFSLIPGAGEMYMGFMKQGISIMAVFWLIVFFASFFSLGPALFILPILWCYSFFNVHNIRGMSDEEFYALEDDYLFHMDESLLTGKLRGKQSNILAAALIIVGVAILWNHFANYLSWLLPDSIYWGFMDAVPQLGIAVLLIWCGIYLIRGKKKELDGKESRQEEWNPMPGAGQGARSTMSGAGAWASAPAEKHALADKALEQQEAGGGPIGAAATDDKPMEQEG